MELPVALQARELGEAALMGLALAVCYDVLRGPRRLWRRCGWAMDLLFSAALFYGCLWLTLVSGRGVFRLHHGAGLALGAGAWFLTIGPPFLRGWMVVLRKIQAGFALIFRPAAKFLKKSGQIAKKLFSIGEKWGKILCKLVFRPARAHAKGGNTHAVQTVVYADEAADSGSGGICRRYPGFIAEPGHGEAGRGRSSAPEH